jgi:hypothetical protein
MKRFHLSAITLFTMQEDDLRSCFREFLLLMRVNNVAGGKRISLGNPDVEKAVDNIYAARPQMHVVRKGRELFHLIRTCWRVAH